ncbi:glycosyltransferase [Amphritea sp. HPY]|uniref:glycosyltransferase n=1 Tax=Amphritea sp. HPY TaxID=3421652 RepID=UPI003D7E30B6
MKFDVCKPVVSVIIPIFDQWDLVSGLFDALSNQTLANEKWEVILVDNGSDYIPDIEELDYKISLFCCEKPGSYSARNFGVNESQGELLVFTDADCVPEPSWLESIYFKYLECEGKFLMAGDVIVDKVSNTTPNIVELFDMLTGLPQSRYVDKGYAVTANLSIPRKVYDSVGGFDETRFSGGDAVFCREATSKPGVELHFLSEAVVHHPARTRWSEIATKVRRVKGGQIRSGSIKRRLKFLIITVVPPFWKIYRIVISDRVSLAQKLKICCFQLLLWFFELYETALLLLGKSPERR